MCNNVFPNQTAFQMEMKLTDMSAIMDSVVGDSLRSIFSPQLYVALQPYFGHL